MTSTARTSAPGARWCSPFRAVVLSRWLRVLSHPATVVAVAAWITNDLWLKGSWPGVVTGKVGDVASLVALVPAAGTVMAALVPARWLRAVPYLAAGAVVWLFTVLNLSPALAQTWSDALSAHVMPSRWWADPTDLLAVPAVLVPLWLWHHVGGEAPRWGARLAQGALLPLVAAASLATSCAADPVIAAVAAAGDDVWVASADNFSTREYAVSRDGGVSWDVETPPDAVRRDLDQAGGALIRAYARVRPKSIDPVVACDAGDGCWRAAGDAGLEHSTDAGETWTAAWEVPADQRADVAVAEDVGCYGETPIGVSDVVHVEGSVVAAAGAQGILVGNDTSFELRGVEPLGVHPASDEGVQWWWADTLFPPVVGIALTLLGAGATAAALVAVVLLLLRRFSHGRRTRG